MIDGGLRVSVISSVLSVSVLTETESEELIAVGGGEWRRGGGRGQHVRRQWDCLVFVVIY